MTAALTLRHTPESTERRLSQVIPCVISLIPNLLRIEEQRNAPFHCSLSPPAWPTAPHSSPLSLASSRARAPLPPSAWPRSSLSPSAWPHRRRPARRQWRRLEMGQPAVVDAVHGLGHSDRHHDLADPAVRLGAVLERRPPSSPGVRDGHVFNTSP
jgi:hypothetical protein